MALSSNPIESSGMRRASRGPTKVLKEHTTWVTCVAYFPDGRRIATASDDKTVIIWDVESGRRDGKPLRHDSSVGGIALSPNGRRIARGTAEGGLVIWDVLTREMVHEIKGDGVWRLAYSPDGRWIATTPSGNRGEIWLWDADTGRPDRVSLKCDNRVWCMAFSPNGSRIAAGLDDGSFQVVDIATGESVLGPIKGHTGWVLSIVYSPDERLLITASWDKSIRVWDSKTGVQVGKPILGHKSEVNCISITTDGQRIASVGWDGTIRVWNLETRLQVGDSFDARGPVFSVAFSPNGRYLISGENDGTVYLWDTESSSIQGPSSPPTTSNRNPSEPITHRVRQQRRARVNLHNHASSTNSSLLDLPAVAQQQPATQLPQVGKPSVDDDWWDTESIRPRVLPTEPQQDLPPEQDTLTVQPAVTSRKWSRDIRERWRHIRHRKLRVPAVIPDGTSHLLPPLYRRANAPASQELSTNRARQEKAADTHENEQGPHSTARPSRNQIEANVALGQADERLAIAAPRGRKGRRFRARAQRGGVQANSHSDTDSESEDSDAESEYVDTGCLDAICFGEYFKRRRYLQGR
ncbi:WD40 repeat-like protein [Leucogyrophana mollusca]|uniref:WD40 repeat-like protein n=1 Tax=Leucogyrophana mollusca TaxID=85980 RepID=A0ACB8B1D3_9AGAM|nr:WD40 repeat-like protein [Leucogyrophana mollusca]